MTAAATLRLPTIDRATAQALDEYGTALRALDAYESGLPGLSPVSRDQHRARLEQLRAANTSAHAGLVALLLGDA